MVKVCLDCNEIYGNSLKFDEMQDYQFCPKASCNGEVIEVDDLLLPTIIELNNKGYSTKYCCSGHYYESVINSYIMFESYVELPNLPNGYVLEKDCNTIRNSFIGYEKSDSYKYFELINKNANSLLKWAKKLPDNEY